MADHGVISLLQRMILLNFAFFLKIKSTPLTSPFQKRWAFTLHTSSMYVPYAYLKLKQNGIFVASHSMINAESCLLITCTSKDMQLYYLHFKRAGTSSHDSYPYIKKKKVCSFHTSWLERGGWHKCTDTQRICQLESFSQITVSSKPWPITWKVSLSSRWVIQPIQACIMNRPKLHTLWVTGNFFTALLIGQFKKNHLHMCNTCNALLLHRQGKPFKCNISADQITSSGVAKVTLSKMSKFSVFVLRGGTHFVLSSKTLHLISGIKEPARVNGQHF